MGGHGANVDGQVSNLRMTKSPFFLIRHFLPPSLCEQIIDYLPFSDPDVDKNGYPLPQYVTNDTCQTTIINRITSSTLIQQLEDHFIGFEFKGSTKFSFVRLTEQCRGIEPHGENCAFINGKWAQVKPYDLTCYIALNENNDRMPFDASYEVYGGKYQFINHQFGFMPERGTLIVHPSSPHFVNAHGEIKFGELTFVKFHLVSQTPMIYQPTDYPGNFTTWFTGARSK